MFKNSSLKFKMLFAFMFVAVFVLIVAGTSYFTMEKVHKEYSFIAEVVVDNLKTVNEMGLKTNDANRFILLAFATRIPEEITKLRENFYQDVKDLEELDAKYRSIPFQPGEKEVHDTFIASWNEYKKISESFFQLLLSKDEDLDNKVKHFRETVLSPARTKMNNAYHGLFKYHTDNAHQKNEIANSVYSLTSWLNSIFSILGITVAFGVGWFFSTSISKRLDQFSNEIATSSDMTSNASHELTSASSSLSQGATESAASLEETVSSLEELSSMVKLNSDHAKEANSLSQRSLSSAEVGETEIKNLILAMSEMQKSSKKIEEIINVIDDIAFQTNLLALNAAVEAARAGEQGKGFAVVADAVRNLASRSAAAAKDINGLIKENVGKTEEGAKTADKSGIALHDILASVKKVADLNSEISAASQEQANGIEQISKAMNHLDAAIQTNASSSQEVASSAEAMTDQSRSLAELVTSLRTFVRGGKSSTAQEFKAPPSSPFQPKKPNKPTKPLKKNVIPFDDDDASGGPIGKAEGF